MTHLLGQSAGFHWSERSERKREPHCYVLLRGRVDQGRLHVADLERRATEAEAKLRRLYDAIDVGDPSLKDRIAELKATRDQARGDAERAVARH